MKWDEIPEGCRWYIKDHERERYLVVDDTTRMAYEFTPDGESLHAGIHTYLPNWGPGQVEEWLGRTAIKDPRGPEVYIEIGVVK